MKIAGVVLLMGGPMWASISFQVNGTATNTVSGSSAQVQALVQFDVFANQIQITITNQIVGASKDMQGISGIDFVLSTGQTAASITSRSGDIITIASGGSWSAASPANFSASAYDNKWTTPAAAQTNQLAGSVALTALNGNNTLTIYGGPNALNKYNSFGNPSNAVLTHNPYVATGTNSAVFTLSIAGVTASTTITQVRFFFGTDRNGFLDGSMVATPEPATGPAVGIALAAVLCFTALGRGYKRRSRRSSPNFR